MYFFSEIEAKSQFLRLYIQGRTEYAGLCNFLGISIYMYFEDHNPPHFHALYNEKQGAFTLNPLKYSEGDLPHRVVGLVIEWAELHKQELLDNWKYLKETGKYKKIKPLV